MEEVKLDTVQVQAQVNMLIMQRDAALAQVVNMAGDVAVLIAKLSALEKLIPGPTTQDKENANG